MLEKMTASKKKTEKKVTSVNLTHVESKTDRVMLENFVSLQRVMTNLSVKLDGLTTQISKLLELFEISAKALAEREFDIEKDNRVMLEKLDNLLDQNKVLARGVTLVHERIPREPYSPPQQMQQSMMQQAFAPSPEYMKEITSQSAVPQVSSLPSTPKKPFSKEILESPSFSVSKGPIPSTFSKSKFESPVER